MTSALEPTDKDFERMMQMLTGFWVTQITGAVAGYSIADQLAKGPATAEQVAAIAGIDPTATFRLLRACASLGLVTFDGLTFSATPLLGTLRANVPGSLHSLAIAFSAPGHWLSWGRFPQAVRTGESQTVPALGTKLWDYYAQNPEEGGAFTSAMQGFTSGIAQEVARVVDTFNRKTRGRHWRRERNIGPQSIDGQLAIAWHCPGFARCGAERDSRSGGAGLGGAQQGIWRRLFCKCSGGGYLFAQTYSA
jgi:Dimerisation domain